MNDPGVWLHIVTVAPIMIFKLSVLLVGYLIAKLGYSLLLKGITGEFKFKAEFKGHKADLVSASPGIFFILMATILITVAIVKDKPFETTYTITEPSGIKLNRNVPMLPSSRINELGVMTPTEDSLEFEKETAGDTNANSGGKQ